MPQTHKHTHTLPLAMQQNNNFYLDTTKYNMNSILFLKASVGFKSIGLVTVEKLHLVTPSLKKNLVTLEAWTIIT